jgi:hypothetical protein
MLVLEYGTEDHVPSVVPGVAALTRALDNAGVRYVATPFEGGHVDRMPERISGYLLPAVGRWLRSAH